MKWEVLHMKTDKSKKLKKKLSSVERRCMENICRYYNVRCEDINRIIDDFLNRQSKFVFKYIIYMFLWIFRNTSYKLKEIP